MLSSHWIMCWNAEISLSTFIFGLAAIAINHVNKMDGEYTSSWSLFTLIVASMQLVEWAIWKYGIQNMDVNKILSIIGLGAILAQPFAAAFIITTLYYRYAYIAAYVVWVLLAIYAWSPIDFITTVAKNGHLKWHWLQPRSPMWIISWVAFIVCALYLSNISVFAATGICLFLILFVIISYHHYVKDGTWGTVYCSLINILFAGVIVRAMSKQYGCYMRTWIISLSKLFAIFSHRKLKTKLQTLFYSSSSCSSAIVWYLFFRR